LFTALGLITFAGSALGQATGYTITGGMGNFDIHNRCDEPCDECEIEIEGIHPEDVVHCYYNSNYGAPRVVLSSDGSRTIIDYRNPQHLTSVGAIEHFGISLRALVPGNNIHLRWMRNGAPATVNGLIPVDAASPTGTVVTATQPIMPTISTDVGAGVVNTDGISCTVTNNDPTTAIYIKRRAQVMIGSSVTLEALMPTNAVVTQSYAIDQAPVRLGPGQSLTTVSDMFELETEDNQSAIFACEYYQEIVTTFTGGGPFGGGGTTYTIGPKLGDLMTATIASPGATCAESLPFIVTQPHNVDAAVGREVALQVNADSQNSAGGTMRYQWMKDGQMITNGNGYSGASGDELTIGSLTAAKEGFYSVTITNNCGSVTSQSALVFITGHNIIPAPLGANLDVDSNFHLRNEDVVFVTTCAYAPQGTTYQVKRNGVAITDGPGGASPGGGTVIGSSGNATPEPIMLGISGAQPSDAGLYTITYTNAGGSTSSAQINVSVVPKCNIADVASLGGAMVPDGNDTSDDLIAFLGAFFNSDLSVADVGSLGGSVGGDGSITVDDLIVYLNAFFAPCE
jgi:hypothetical protein